MDLSPLERHQKHWYARLILNPYTHFFIAFLLVVITPFLYQWGWAGYDHSSAVQSNTLYIATFSFISCFSLAYKLRTLPTEQLLFYLLPTILLVWLLVFSFIFFIRLNTYSRPVLFYSFVLTHIWAFAAYFLLQRYGQLKVAVIPFGRTSEILTLPTTTRITLLSEPSLGCRRFDGVIADLHDENLPVQWQQFIAQCTLDGIAVYHVQQAYEAMTGRVKIDHLAENIFGSLQPSKLYGLFKRFADVALVLISMPVWLPVVFITGIAIKLESKGSMFFIQARVGQGGKDFNVYKLRSMCQDSEKDGAQFAQSNDMRVTRVGKFIRKTRIDELPQFFNVLKGDMSLIGPRPEQRAFVNKFEQEIPFYMYRHVVKPGITGWAQVTQGYAADADDTRIKIQHDFYYIKHFSLWLDFVITLKTIYTMLTGFGAR